MRSADAIVVGGGIIGLSLALELRRGGLSVMVIERGEPGREASYAAAGMLAPAVFAFGLVAFGFLGMGPVTISVDSYGPVTDNAQSV